MPNFDIPVHAFTATISDILARHFGEDAQAIFEFSPLLGYLNVKTKSANSGSKARGAFANHYALYVLIQDYLAHGFFDGSTKTPYAKYEGAKFSDLFTAQRKLPFGAKLQNHALNARLNDEFRKFYPSVNQQPIVRDVETQRYWIQEDLLLVQIPTKTGEVNHYNLARAVIDIIDAYVATKKAAFEGFLKVCQTMSELDVDHLEAATTFVVQQLQPNVDARIFEIVSYAVLKAQYGQQTIWIGRTKDSVVEEVLHLYKTGRTNANDGGIDFVMKPLGRFFQVTETIDVRKYFLDIDKVQRFPITFVVKSDESSEQIRAAIQAQAIAKYKIDAVVASYMNAIEEIINVQDLLDAFRHLVSLGKVREVMDEIITQSKVEFNYRDDTEDELDAM